MTIVPGATVQSLRNNAIYDNALLDISGAMSLITLQ